MCKVMIAGNEVACEKGTTYEQIAKAYQKDYAQPIALACFNGRLRELNKCVEEDGELSFVTTADKAGIKAYRRTEVLLLQKAVDELLGAQGGGVRVLQTTGNGQYCELTGTDQPVTEAFLESFAACQIPGSDIQY